MRLSSELTLIPTKVPGGIPAYPGYPTGQGNRRQYRQRRWPVMVASLLLIATLALLLVATLQSQKEIRSHILSQKHLDIVNKARIFQFFINERGKNLQELAGGAVISGYFVNQALGMSEAYGLRASRNQVVRHFTSLNRAVSSEGQSVFARLSLFAGDGTLVAEMDNVPGQLQPEAIDLLAEKANLRNRFAVMIDPGNPNYLLFIAAVGKASATDGYVAGWVSLFQLFAELFSANGLFPGAETDGAGLFALWAGEQRFLYTCQLSPATVTALTEYLAREPKGEESTTRVWPGDTRSDRFTNRLTGESFLLFPPINLAHGLCLRSITPEASVFTGRSPLVYTLKMSLLSAVVLILFFVAVSFRKKAELNSVQLRHLQLSKVVAEEMNKALNREINQRQQAQKRLSREKALLQSERERFNLVITATRVGLWDWHVDSNELTVNERWSEIVGYRLEELQPFTLKTWTDLLHPEDGERAIALLKRHLQGEIDYYSCETRMRHKQGHWVWIHDQGQVVEWTADGRARRMSGTHTDISEKKATEQRLQESEQNFRAFFESIVDMIFVISPAGEIIYANPAAHDKLGYPAGVLTGKPLLDLHPPALRDEAGRVFTAMLSGQQHNCPLALQTSDAATIPVDTRVWHGRWNDCEVFFGISKDLSAEEEAKQKFERVFRNNPALMSLAAADSHTLIDVNDSFLNTLGFSRQEVIGRTFAELALFVDQTAAAHALGRVEEVDRVAGIRLQIRTRSGVILDGLFSSESINSQGESLMLMVMINITDLENTKRQLRLANETLDLRVKERTRELEELHNRMLVQDKMASLGQLAAGVAHELNNPINFVTTNFSALKDYFTDLSHMVAVYREHATGQARELIADREEEYRIDYILDDIPDLFNESERGFERIAKIIRSMREFAHTDLTGQFVLFDLNAGIEETLNIARNTYKYCAEVRTSYGDIPKICCIPDLLKQVFLNLVVNSAQAIEAENRAEHGLIEISTSRQGDHLLCTFADDGPGVPEEIMHRVFDPFFTTKPPGKGTGLGLSLCYEMIVQKHHGELRVSSPPAGGTTFTIRLPIGQEAAGSPCQTAGT